MAYDVSKKINVGLAKKYMFILPILYASEKLMHEKSIFPYLVVL